MSDQELQHPEAQAAGMLPNLRHLHVLELVAREGSISQAASEANLTQPAVTQAISRLELSVGYPLFERGNHGTKLTEAGEIYLQRVHRFFRICETAIGETCRHLPSRNRLHYLTSAQLRCLQAVTQHASVAEAATSIGVSTSTLKRALRELETILCLPLREQTRYGKALNRTGRELAQQISLAINELTAAQEELAVLDGREVGRISIGTLPQSGAYVIGEAIAELTQHHPEVQISVANAPYSMLVSALLSSEIDMIFGMLRDHGDDSGITEEPLFSDPYCILASAGHPLADQAHVDIEDLLDFEWVAPTQGSPRRKRFEQIFASANRRPKVYIEMSNLPAILAILTRTNFLTLVSRLEIQRELDLGTVRTIPVSISLPPMAKGLTCRSNWKPTPIQARFLDILRSRARLSELALAHLSFPNAPDRIGDRNMPAIV